MIGSPKRIPSLRSRSLLIAAAVGAAFAIAGRAADGAPVRLFILSGQSNMTRLKPESSFIPALEAAFPGDEILVVKAAFDGTPIRVWCKDWKAPEGWQALPDEKKESWGLAYDILMGEVRARRQARRPATATFVWMQGEADALGARGASETSATYLQNLQGLIARMRTDLGRPDMTFVIGRLSGYRKGDAAWDRVRAAQEKAASDDPLGAWIDTDALNGPKNDDIHMTEEGYVEMGKRFAAKAVELIRRQEEKDANKE
jgi:hypothetical protein